LIDDKTAEQFATYMKKFSDLYVYLSNIVQEYTRTKEPYILDLGAGPGLLSVEILKLIPGATIIGLDPLQKMLLLAKENANQSGIQGFFPLVGVSEKIPLKDQSIDVIVSRFSLPYWKDPSAAFLEMHRILKPQGKIVLEALNKEFSMWKLFGIKIGMLWNNAGRDVTKYHVDAYKLAHTQGEVEAFFNKSGFSILKKEGKKNEWKFIIVAEKN
jgi:ubiquinone/menaquinone biosynthesis C-methylase UbiE